MVTAGNPSATSNDGIELVTLSQCCVCGSRTLIRIDQANRICRCGHCGYVFDNPRPTLRAIVAFYSQPGKYDSWLDEEGNRSLLWKRRLKILKRYRSSGSLLDVGTGTGQFLAIARECFAVKGTEVSEAAVRIARTRYGLDVVQGQIEEVQLGDGFDVITLYHVLEHVPDPLATVRKCRQLLNPGGLLVIAVPNDLVGPRSMAKRMLALAGVGRFKGRRYGLGRIRLDESQGEIHLSHFTPPVLRLLVRRSGLNVVNEGLDPYFVAKGIKKIAHEALFTLCSFIRKTTGLNVYDAMLFVARAEGATTDVLQTADIRRTDKVDPRHHVRTDKLTVAGASSLGVRPAARFRLLRRLARNPPLAPERTPGYQGSDQGQSRSVSQTLYKRRRAVKPQPQVGLADGVIAVVRVCMKKISHPEIEIQSSNGQHDENQ
jgi:SAM-dependent methyltransferase